MMRGWIARCITITVRNVVTVSLLLAFIFILTLTMTLTVTCLADVSDDEL